MPIANCFIKAGEVSMSGVESLAREWANQIDADVKDITVNVITGHQQSGQQYAVLVNLYLPDFWTEDEIKIIQLGLLNSIKECLHIDEEQVFIMTSIIEAGHVVENGKIVSW